MKKIALCICFSAIITCSSCNRLKQYSDVDHQQSFEQQDNTTSDILASHIFYGTDQMNKIAGGKLLFDYLLDEEIGQYMDWQDIMYMQNGVLQTPIHQKFKWENTRRHVNYVVRPIKITYNTVTHQYCRFYELIVKVKDQIEKNSGRVCHEVNGRWYVD